MKEVNGWVVLALAVVLVLSYGFAYVNMRMMAPAITAQITGNERLVGQLNAVLAQQNKAVDSRFTKVESRLEAVEKAK